MQPVMGQEPKNFSSFSISSILAIGLPMSTSHLLTVCQTVTQLGDLYLLIPPAQVHQVHPPFRTQTKRTPL